LDIRSAFLRRLIHTASFRLATIYLAIFAVSVVVLGAVVYLIVGREMEIEFDGRLRNEVAGLRAYFLANGLERLTEEVRIRTFEAASLDYCLEDAAGRRLAGNLPSTRIEGDENGERWVQLAEPISSPKSGKDWERALVTGLDGDAVLVVGQDLAGIKTAKEAVLIAFAWALAGTLVLGLSGGLAVSATFLRRIEVMTTAAQQIIAGDLAQRIPASRQNDDLGRLALTFNKMLDRIGSLLDANRQVSNDIAHDLRSPLSRVLRRLEATRARMSGTSENEIAIDAAIDDIHGIIRTFTALLRIGQIETGSRRAGFRTVNLSAIALDVAEAFQPAASDEGRTLATALNEELLMSGDQELLKQLVANLIDNAIRHTRAGSRIEISALRTAKSNLLIVADDGPGVPRDHLQRIFERFYRVARARETPGDGLGLSLVAAIADLHGAQASAVDNEPGLKIAVAFPTAVQSANVLAPLLG
jgi:signal transduction histidine kinase